MHSKTGSWSKSCLRAVTGFRRGSRKREESARNRLSGRRGRRRGRELLPGGRLSSLCLPWDSSAALNMPVIFNQRRNRAQRQPPLLQYFLSVRRGNGREPHFLVTWCGRIRGEVGESEWGKERELGWLRPAHTSPHIHSAPPFSQSLAPTAGQMRQSVLIRCSDVTSRSRDWPSWAAEEMRERVKHIGRQRGGGVGPRDVRTRDPPGLEASKKKRTGTWAARAGENVFLCLSDMGESGTSHELTLFTHRELGLGHVSICANLTTGTRRRTNLKAVTECLTDSYCSTSNVGRYY